MDPKGDGADLDEVVATLPRGSTGLPTTARSGTAGVTVAIEPPREQLAGGRYDARRMLGEGGMGVVWLCQDRRIGRRVAMKVMRPETARDVEVESRFVREARVQGQLEHPAVVPVYDLDVQPDGATYFTMRRVRGVTLEEIVAQLRDPAAAATTRHTRRRLLEAFARVCLAVDFAHEHGVLHRDLKPGNVMLGDFGEVYVLDWGIAKLLGEPDRPSATPDGAVIGRSAPGVSSSAVTAAMIGTPGYMSPEQLRGTPEATRPASDVYALGAVLFELLTLEPLHDLSSVDAALASTLDGVDARPSARAPGREVPPELEAICVRATAADPARRYRTARELHEAVERYLEGERDEALRRDMAERHATAAAAATERALTGGDTAASRREAMREIGRALALDPENVRARRAMARLLTEPPREMPPEVRREAARAAAAERRWSGWVAAAAYASLLLYLPLFLWSGIRSAGPLVVFYVLGLGAAATAAWTARQREPSASPVLAAMMLSTLAFASTTALFGPLVLMPALVAVNLGGYAMILQGRQRTFATIFAAGTVCLFVILDQLGVPEGRYVFGEAGMTIRPGAIGLPRTATAILLGLAALATVLTAALSIARLRDTLAAAQRRLLLYAWQVRQLAPADADTTNRTPS